MAEYLNGPDHCQLGRIVKQLDPGLLQFRAPHAAESERRLQRLHGPDKIGAMQIPRGLAGHDHDLTALLKVIGCIHR